MQNVYLIAPRGRFQETINDMEMKVYFYYFFSSSPHARLQIFLINLIKGASLPLLHLILSCRTALVDLGINDVDPGLAPEGARCGDDSLCVNRKCIPVASLIIGPASCPDNCNGHGMCNSEGHCHCEAGYAPPYCDVPGSGGSLDSGPASDIEEETSGMLFDREMIR